MQYKAKIEGKHVIIQRNGRILDRVNPDWLDSDRPLCDEVMMQLLRRLGFGYVKKENLDRPIEYDTHLAIRSVKMFAKGDRKIIARDPSPALVEIWPELQGIYLEWQYDGRRSYVVIGNKQKLKFIPEFYEEVYKPFERMSDLSRYPAYVEKTVIDFLSKRLTKQVHALLEKISPSYNSTTPLLPVFPKVPLLTYAKSKRARRYDSISKTLHREVAIKKTRPKEKFKLHGVKEVTY